MRKHNDSTKEGVHMVSVVVPVYQSENCVEQLVARVRAAFAPTQRKCEIILVNDCSPDGSWAEICRQASLFVEVRGISLRRNAGQDCAIMAGLRTAAGEVVVIMDDDLQHDPADIEKLVRGVEAGADVCYARFLRKKQAFWKNCGSWLNDKLANVVVSKPREVYLSPFKAVSGEVVREITQYDGPFPYVDGLLFRVTSNVTQVDVEHHDRFAGHGNFSLTKSFGVWMRVATLFSLAPLRLATVLGFISAGVGLFLALFFIAKKLLFPGDPVGWASMIVAVLVLGGVQLACMGVIGEYLGRVFLHISKRPQYVVKERTDRPSV
jgi:polyisoprenyl-phosphate glycosyltransferase